MSQVFRLVRKVIWVKDLAVLIYSRSSFLKEGYRSIGLPGSLQAMKIDSQGFLRYIVTVIGFLDFMYHLQSIRKRIFILLVSTKLLGRP
jgi:hypothetical protein